MPPASSRVERLHCQPLRQPLWGVCAMSFGWSVSACKQSKIARMLSSLLWVLLWWSVARVKAHIDRTRFGATAVQCSWLGLSQEYVDAHELQARSTPAWKLDPSSTHVHVRFGPAVTERAPGSNKKWPLVLYPHFRPRSSCVDPP